MFFAGVAKLLLAARRTQLILAIEKPEEETPLYGGASQHEKSALFRT